jgi:hypothetical protein
MRNIRCKQGILWLSIAIILTTQFGCAHKPPIRHPSEQVKTHLGSITIVPANFIPESNFNTFAKGRLSGAGKGAAFGAGYFAVGALTSGPFGILLFPVFAVVGGVIGGVIGAVDAVPEAKAQDIETAINNALAELKIQETMAEHVLKSGMDLTNYNFDLLEGRGPNSYNEKPKYAFLKKDNIDAVLEISVRDVGLEDDPEERSSISLFMTVYARLIRVEDETEICSQTFEYKGRRFKFSDWVDNDAKIFREEFDRCYKKLSEQLIEDLFLLYVFHMDSYWSTSKFCGLSPLYPEFTLELRYPEVDSLQPTLVWESFPRQKDKEADKAGLLSKISEVTYDLKIWKVEEKVPTELVYSKQCLTESKHKIELPLEVSTKYFWTMRARLELDGQPRVTKWSYSRVPWIVDPSLALFPGAILFDPPDDPCKLNYIPNRNYFCFITPKK